MVAGADSKDEVELRTRDWLEANYQKAIESAHDPSSGVYDRHGQLQRLNSYAFQEVLRKLKIFRWLERFEFGNFIDIGSGFDHYPNLVRRRYGVPSYFSDFAHSLNFPYGGAAYGKLDHAVTLNINRLPFADETFDTVISSEVLEHLVRPVEAIAELLRITKKYLIMTSLEALAPNRWERLLAHLRVDVREPHVERNFFLMHELEALFGADWQHQNLWHDDAMPVSQFSPPAAQEAAYAALNDRDAFAAALTKALSISDHRGGSMGILIVKTKNDAPIQPPRTDDSELARWLIDETAAAHAAGYTLVEEIRRGSAEFAKRDRPIDGALLALVRCPDCRGTLEPAGGGLRCEACAFTFAGEYGVPILYPNRPQDTDGDPSSLYPGDPQRQQIISQLAHRLRRNEDPPGLLRRLLWKVDRGFGRSG